MIPISCELDPANTPSPLYTACTFVSPGCGRIVSVATPVPSTVATPSAVVPARNVTDPVGTIGSVHCTTEISVTCCPPLIDVAELVSTSLDGCSRTVSPNAAETLPISSLSPA